jgi:hypothetical protein
MDRKIDIDREEGNWPDGRVVEKLFGKDFPYFSVTK